jgi:sporulation protein YlmC with PRC-barrel domain
MTANGGRAPELRPEPRQPGRVVDARLHLLDRQVLDVEGVPVTVVDDLELDDASTPVVTALLSGPVLGARIFGGRPPSSRWHRLPWRLVTDVGAVVRLGARAESLDIAWLERWVRDEVVGRIPGGRHNPEGSS